MNITMASDGGHEYGSVAVGDSGDKSLDGGDDDEKCKLGLGESVGLSSFPW